MIAFNYDLINYLAHVQRT